jgi:hypothetical protein
MRKEEKLHNIYTGFSLLDERKQDYILGILQALVFANNADESATKDSPRTETQENESKDGQEFIRN